MEELLKKILTSREVAHAMHLKTGNNIYHIALDMYYTDIVDMIDDLSETYQGQYDIILDDVYEIEGEYDLTKIKEYFEDLVKYVKDSKKDIINDDNDHLISILDDIVILIYKVLYKIKL